MATKPRLDIQSKRFMVIITWNPSGFYVVDRLPNDTKMNSNYFIANIFISFEKAIFPRGRAPHQKRLVIYFRKGSVHTSRASRDWLKEYGMRRTPHSPYSPDLAPSDFYLFPPVKEKLEWIQVGGEDSFLSSCKRFGRPRTPENNEIAHFKPFQ
jgi:histone-lysine N-methyltransferase SETMAR